MCSDSYLVSLLLKNTDTKFFLAFMKTFYNFFNIHSETRYKELVAAFKKLPATCCSVNWSETRL
jgi:hypothetical protein